MSSDIVSATYEFNTKGQIVPPGRTFNADRVGFYTGMQLEEIAEKLTVIGEGILTPEERKQFNDAVFEIERLGRRFKEGRYMGAVLRADRVELLDADIDQIVVSVGSMIYQTPNFKGAIAEVIRANNDKFPGGVVLRDPQTHKILKPEGWKAPDLTPFVIRDES